ncbi:hypothetical protein [Candidatus Protochlamydia amoebophila]|uniref:Uncharacterized protein n=1 Tax=Protochlamydia amoebophila (strain UWE25) TaxID=264201 RepID=A0A2P9HAF5_PARUW|nr:hypothetical protein [Candidatus Protochlamydia amoebophila]SPJ32000.1 unnamed protein product [Candidatus Protochlamydia amoebophila UWE25]
MHATGGYPSHHQNLLQDVKNVLHTHVELSRLKKQAHAETLAAHAETLAAQQKAAKSGQEVLKAQQDLILANRELQGAQKELQHAQNNLAAAKAIVLTNIFQGVFCLPKIETTATDYALEMAAKYQLDTALELNQRERTSIIKSMAPFIAYLKSHSDVQKCNFKAIKQVNDVKSFAQYLQDATCKVRLVGFNKDLSVEDQQALAAAVMNRKGTLKVQYL